MTNKNDWGDIFLSYHIRQAMVSDIPAISEQLKAFSDHYSTKLPPFKDQETSERILKKMIEDHLFYVAVTESDHELIGLIAGFVSNHVYNPDIKVLAEAFWWIKPEHRRSGAGMQLLEVYEDWGKKNVDWLLMTIEEDTPLDEQLFLDRGYRRKEKSYIMENV